MRRFLAVSSGFLRGWGEQGQRRPLVRFSYKRRAEVARHVILDAPPGRQDGATIVMPVADMGAGLEAGDMFGRAFGPADEWMIPPGESRGPG